LPTPHDKIATAAISNAQTRGKFNERSKNFRPIQP
jgi:hypothetical protein